MIVLRLVIVRLRVTPGANWRSGLRSRKLRPTQSPISIPIRSGRLIPSDDGARDGSPGLYWGAAGVIWALDYLHRIGAVRVAEDFRPVLPKLLDSTVASFESKSPAGYARHGSLLFGDMGAALVAMRLAPTSSLADLVHARAEANIRLPIRELMWGMPGSMLAAIHMAEMTREPRWRALFEMQAARLFADLEDTPQGPLWTQDLYGANDRWLGPVHGFAGNVIPLLRGWHWLTPAQQAQVSRICAEDPCGECVAVRSRDDMGRAQQARDAANDVSALSRCARHGDDICGCAVRGPRV
jgi:hypothetical protein